MSIISLWKWTNIWVVIFVSPGESPKFVQANYQAHPPAAIFAAYRLREQPWAAENDLGGFVAGCQCSSLPLSSLSLMKPPNRFSWDMASRGPDSTTSEDEIQSESKRPKKIKHIFVPQEYRNTQKTNIQKDTKHKQKMHVWSCCLFAIIQTIQNSNKYKNYIIYMAVFRLFSYPDA